MQEAVPAFIYLAPLPSPGRIGDGGWRLRTIEPSISFHQLHLVKRYDRIFAAGVHSIVFDSSDCCTISPSYLANVCSIQFYRVCSFQAMREAFFVSSDIFSYYHTPVAQLSFKLDLLYYQTLVLDPNHRRQFISIHPCFDPVLQYGPHTKKKTKMGQRRVSPERDKKRHGFPLKMARIN